MSAFVRELRRELRGDVLADDVARGIYATDASSYQIVPRAVAVPRDADDVRSAVRIAHHHRVPILPRGGGTSLAGQTVGAALVLDFSRHLNRILELDAGAGWARVEPGLVRDELNAAVAGHGLHFAPDPSTSSRAAIGGMIGNNSAGTRSIRCGMTIDHVLALKVLLADGSELELGPLGPEERAAARSGVGRGAEILRGLERVVGEHRVAIRTRFPRTLRRVGGYPLDRFLGDAWNPAQLLVGSEGTLAVILEAKLHLDPLPAHTALCVVHFADLMAAVRAVEPILAFEPSAVEIVDLRPVLRRLAGARLPDFFAGDPAAVLIVELEGEGDGTVAAAIRALAAELAGRGLGYAHPVFLGPEQDEVWRVRKQGFGQIRGDRRPLPFIEDAAVPVAVLPQYIERVLALCRENGTEVVLNAHASVGLIHVRPILDLKRAEDVERMRRIAETAFEMVVGYRGSWSSEHGDGLVRSPFNERFFGPEIYRAFQEVKRLFDPDQLMNPGKIVDAGAIDENLRYGPGYRVAPIASEFRFAAGGFAAAVEACDGSGQCRKTLTGTLCPTYIATRDEAQSTRGRANALRLAMSGQLGAGGLASDRLHKALELCIGCKACKAECPSNVDLARLKSETLQRAWDRRGAPLRDRLAAGSPAVAARLAGPWAPLVNRLQGSGLFRRVLEISAGIDRRRVLPDVAREPFPAWLARHPERRRGAPRVALFADTCLCYHQPEIGRAAVDLLRSCGYDVVLAEAGCCQRPRISHGYLRRAKRDGERTLRNLHRLIEEGLPVVVCEPSCASALIDDLPDLVDDRELGRRVASGVRMIDVFLDRELAGRRLATGFGTAAGKVLIHGHCHQKALWGTGAMQRVLGRVEGLEVAEIDAGCCGMAGAFGYGREHYELSRKIGEDRLFPAIRELGDDDTIIACGASCRQQIEHFTGRRAVHWVEVLRPGPAAPGRRR